jgi:hypothetical protein
MEEKMSEVEQEYQKFLNKPDDKFSVLIMETKSPEFPLLWVYAGYSKPILEHANRLSEESLTSAIKYLKMVEVILRESLFNLKTKNLGNFVLPPKIEENINNVPIMKAIKYRLDIYESQLTQTSNRSGNPRKITDANGNLLGVEVDGKMIWLAELAIVGNVLSEIRKNNESYKEISRRAAQKLLPPYWENIRKEVFISETKKKNSKSDIDMESTKSIILHYLEK